jgi:hypothetical protein
VTQNEFDTTDELLEVEYVRLLFADIINSSPVAKLLLLNGSLKVQEK